MPKTGDYHGTFPEIIWQLIDGVSVLQAKNLEMAQHSGTVQVIRKASAI